MRELRIKLIINIPVLCWICWRSECDDPKTHGVVPGGVSLEYEDGHLVTLPGEGWEESEVQTLGSPLKRKAITTVNKRNLIIIYQVRKICDLELQKPTLPSAISHSYRQRHNSPTLISLKEIEQFSCSIPNQNVPRALVSSQRSNANTRRQLFSLPWILQEFHS